MKIMIFITGMLVLFSALPRAVDLPLIEGEFSREEILEKLPDYRQRFDAYVPADSMVRELPGLTGDVEIYAVFGSWCSDSLKHVPDFMKILEQSRFPEANVHYIAVNRLKVDPEGAVSSLDIQKVPTFIFLKAGKEIGRIIENPQASLETDMLQLLRPHPEL